MNNIQPDLPPQMDQKNRDIPHLMSQPAQPPSLMSHPGNQSSNFDHRANPLISPNSNRAEKPLSERLAHLMQTQGNHDPRLHSNQFRNHNSDSGDGNRYHSSSNLPNTKEPPPPASPSPAFKQDSSFKNDHASFNHVNSNFQDRKSDVNIPASSSQLPFNQPPPGFPKPPLSFPPREYIFSVALIEHVHPKFAKKKKSI